MKSEIKKDPEKFVNSHSYIETLVIHYKDKTSFFFKDKKDNSRYYQELFYNDLIEGIKTAGKSDGYYFALNANGTILYILLKDGIVFIFQCLRGTSVAQIKMEISDFVEGFQVQGKYRRFFSSIFDW
ncbi:hypothetical protein MTBBW1_2130089 [Desulfamplus magnetovallimortis]|uniref:FUZ/MON1/HPS1 first Longin domain-containing protein n=1 Tax=Desulfamplus magnetovallimortis TaxID=1246637 RepID=A0A1W1HCH2_9BACT|nr:hypothetical protein [Desulfamplus magnetovallimortis]SLM30194.1 hypothetical protein MTBBW1_2130089 [Desulfamplus magnetovallimortis]